MIKIECYFAQQIFVGSSYEEQSYSLKQNRLLIMIHNENMEFELKETKNKKSELLSISAIDLIIF